MIRVPVLAALAAPALALTPAASAELLYGLTTANEITIFDSAAPGVSIDGGAVTGLAAGENLRAIDYRAANGQVYLLGSTRTLYTFDATTFAATAVGQHEADPRIQGVSYAFDFNPAFTGGQFARIITDVDQNRVISGDTALFLGGPKTDVFYDAGDANEGADPNIAGIAYTNSLGVPASTQQYGIDRTLGVLVTVANNAGTLATVGSLGATPITDELGLDISGATGVAYANLQTGPNSVLYTIDLGTGAATPVGTITSGNLIRDLTVIPVPEPASAALVAFGGLAMLRRRR